MMKIFTYRQGQNLFMAFALILCSIVANSQTDSLKTNQPDTTQNITKDQTAKKKEKGWNDEFIVYVGGSLNMLGVESSKYESHSTPGYMLGGAYKRGKFFYWQVGARYNNAVYRLSDLTMPTDTSFTDSTFNVGDIGIPLTAGINFLSVTNRIFALRLFVSAIPSFVVGVGGNDLGITKDQVNTFNLYGQAGLGVNVFFMVIETGVNYGFMDVLKNDQSKPVQFFVHLGFRF
jgi:hypothetical protein